MIKKIRRSRYGIGTVIGTVIKIELTRSTEGYVFSASANIKGKDLNGQKIEMYGQCLDSVLEFFPKDKTVKKIHNWWKKYHLNNLKPDCEHGINEELAKKEIMIHTYSLKTNIISTRDKIKERVIESAIKKKNVYLTDLEIKLLSLEWYFESDVIDKHLEKYYEISKSTVTKAAHVFHYVSKKGVLLKPCPICGYKYGSAWNFKEIPENDLSEIIKMLEA